MRLDELLTEATQGKYLIGYHRAKSMDVANAVAKTGFVVGGGAGALYGPGVYLTYDLESQLNERMMMTYGAVIVRCKVNLDGFAIFDDMIAQQIYGSDHRFKSPFYNDAYKIFSQMKNFFKTGQWRLTTDGKERYKDYRKSMSKSGEDIVEPWAWLYGAVVKEDNIYERTSAFTADSAKPFVRLCEGYRGLVFTGRQDGSVIVATDPSTVIPYSAAYSTDGFDEEETPQPLVWVPLNPSLKRQRKAPVLTVGAFRWVEGREGVFNLLDASGALRTSVVVGGGIVKSPTPHPKNVPNTVYKPLFDHLGSDITLYMDWIDYGYVTHKGVVRDTNADIRSIVEKIKAGPPATDIQSAKALLTPIMDYVAEVFHPIGLWQGVQSSIDAVNMAADLLRDHLPDLIVNPYPGKQGGVELEVEVADDF